MGLASGGNIAAAAAPWRFDAAQAAAPSLATTADGHGPSAPQWRFDATGPAPSASAPLPKQPAPAAPVRWAIVDNASNTQVDPTPSAWRFDAGTAASAAAGRGSSTHSGSGGSSRDPTPSAWRFDDSATPSATASSDALQGRGGSRDPTLGAWRFDTGTTPSAAGSREGTPSAARIPDGRHHGEV